MAAAYYFINWKNSIMYKTKSHFYDLLTLFCEKNTFMIKEKDSVLELVNDR